MKKNLLISFSGGRTSAMMTKWMLENLNDKYEMIVCFANTGKEKEETLKFVNKCDLNFGFKTVWLETLVNENFGKGSKHKIVNFENASRNGEPFEMVIKKYGIPNKRYPHCTRELKLAPIKSYLKEINFLNYFTALGIRTDEPKRINREKAKKEKLLFFADFINVTKLDVNNFWNKQSFDLNLKSYEGNCDLCFKKSFRKLLTLIKENEKITDWWKEMELKYSNYIPSTRNQEFKPPFYFGRDNTSIDELIEESKFDFELALDESKVVNNYNQLKIWQDYYDSNDGCTESCEII
jgi:3'-phosphoadenosine 5'-phosphosulfate sulfotransferase (PAPS reductase)/FAD synthetase